MKQPKLENDGTYVHLGERMYPIGIGMYPYDCRAKDKYPGHMVYKTADGSAWDHRPVEPYGADNKTKQEKHS